MDDQQAPRRPMPGGGEGNPHGGYPGGSQPSRRRDVRGARSGADEIRAAGLPVRTPWLWALAGLVPLALIGWVVLHATIRDTGAAEPTGLMSGSPLAGAPSAGRSAAPVMNGRTTPSASPTGPASPASPTEPASGAGRTGGSQALVASPIVGVQSGKCVDVAGGSTADLTPIDLARCDDGAAQAISYTAAGELRVLGKCLDAKGAGTDNGTPIILYTCTGQPNQKWYLGSDDTIRGVQSSLCLDATGFGTADGTPLQLWSCTGGANQAWNT